MLEDFVKPAEEKPLDPHLVTLAAAALQGLLACPDRFPIGDASELSVRYARKTLEKLKEEQ